ncbi:MAG TPA: hypothetical protein VGO72_07440 [Herminiimonas sp.]|nr:hypothetical protein [Herminiimonas sp.]
MDTDMLTDMIGWASALILLLTVSSQVYKQWRTRTSAGVSKWLFLGQISASLGFVVYSVALENWVFVATNSFLLLTAVLGQFLYLRNKRTERARKQHASDAKAAGTT